MRQEEYKNIDLDLLIRVRRDHESIYINDTDLLLRVGGDNNSRVQTCR